LKTNIEQEIFERILAELARGEHAEEVKQARDVFFERLRDLRDDDPSFERLTACFLNWYVFDRRMDGCLETPLQIFVATHKLSAGEKTLLAALAGNIHSLFEVLRIDRQSIDLRDMFSSETLRVTERRALAGLDPGDILEARLLPLNDKLVFASGAYVLHPRAARGLIRKAAERSRTSGTPEAAELIMRLQALSFRYLDRFKQRVPVEKVYTDITGGQ